MKQLPSRLCGRATFRLSPFTFHLSPFTPPVESHHPSPTSQQVLSGNSGKRRNDFTWSLSPPRNAERNHSSDSASLPRQPTMHSTEGQKQPCPVPLCLSPICERPSHTPA